MDFLLLAVPAAFYLGFPLLIKFTQNVDPIPKLEPIAPADWPQSVAQTMSRVEHDLYNLGFTITARYKMHDAMPNSSTMLSMLVNYKTGDKVMITAIWGLVSGEWKLGTLYTEFSTKFEDGHCFDTMNSATLSAFKTMPKDVKTRVPSITEAAELWALHRYVMRKHIAQGRKVVYDMQEVDAYLKRIWRQSFEEQVQFGRYVVKGDRFQPTFKGAYLMAWGIMWPMSTIRRMQMNSRATAIIREWKASNCVFDSAFDESRVVIMPESKAVFGN